MSGALAADTLLGITSNPYFPNGPKTQGQSCQGRNTGQINSATSDNMTGRKGNTAYTGTGTMHPFQHGAGGGKGNSVPWPPRYKRFVDPRPQGGQVGRGSHLGLSSNWGGRHCSVFPCSPAQTCSSGDRGITHAPADTALARPRCVSRLPAAACSHLMPSRKSCLCYFGNI